MGQSNKFIKEDSVYSKEGVPYAEGCVTTALGQVLKYWDKDVKRITFGKPFGGVYYDKFTAKSFDYPYLKGDNNFEKKDYQEIQFNISKQITTKANGGVGLLLQ